MYAPLLYFVWLTAGNCKLQWALVTGGQVSLRVVNVTWTDLDSLAFILHFFNHF
jgi:hypothetical protein